MAKAIICGKSRPLKVHRTLMKIGAFGAVATSVTATPVRADGWGCQVLLCLADPKGPETQTECKPPIEKLWNALEHGKPFPLCDLSSSIADLPPDLRSELPASALTAGQGTSALTIGAGPNYCSPNLLYWGPPDQSTLTCGAQGAINVTIDGTLFTRVWWGLDGASTTEFYGQGSTTIPYDPSKSAQRFLSQGTSNNSSSEAGIHGSGASGDH